MPIADYTNTANTKANANINASQPFTPHDEIIVEIKPLAYNMHITSAVDGKKSSEDILATTPKIYTGKQSVRISYYSGFTADKIQITLNGKQITPPSAPAKGSSIVFEINKENIAQILQSGQIK